MAYAAGISSNAMTAHALTSAKNVTDTRTVLMALTSITVVCAVLQAVVTQLTLHIAQLILLTAEY